MINMPRSSQVAFTCPCGTKFSAKMYQTANITLEPKLLYRLLAGTFNVATCPTCGRKASNGQPFIYHDMHRGLFAYVHPQAEVSTEEREALLAQLRRVYTLAVEESERMVQRRTPTVDLPKPSVRRRRPYDDLQERIEPDAPPMQVIFGVDRLVTLVDSLLEPEEKLGKVALTTRSTDAGSHERLRGIAQRMADQMQCLVEEEEEPDSYAVWIYGPRNRIKMISSALNQRS